MVWCRRTSQLSEDNAAGCELPGVELWINGRVEGRGTEASGRTSEVRSAGLKFRLAEMGFIRLHYSARVGWTSAVHGKIWEVGGEAACPADRPQDREGKRVAR